VKFKPGNLLVSNGQVLSDNEILLVLNYQPEGCGPEGGGQWHSAYYILLISEKKSYWGAGSLESRFEILK